MIRGYELSPFTFLLLANVIMLILGCFLEGTTILLIIAHPVSPPHRAGAGIDPVHFGVVAVVNIMIGLVTPPYGLLLFMMVRSRKYPQGPRAEVMPFSAPLTVALALITYIPSLVLFLPRLMG